MNNKDFAITQEESTKPFALKITRLSTAMPESSDAVVVRNRSLNPERRFVPITVKPTGLEAGLILITELKYAKARPVKPNTGWN